MTTYLPLLVFIGPPRMASTNLRELLGGILCVKGWTKQQNFIILFKYDSLNIMLNSIPTKRGSTSNGNTTNSNIRAGLFKLRASPIIGVH